MPKRRSYLQLTTHNLQLILPLISLIALTSLIFNIIFIVQNRERNRVTRVVDGDSFDLSDGRRIRLLGLDAPERGECMSSQAYEKLKVLAQGRHIRLKNIVTDDYGRLLANVIIEEPSSWISYLWFRFLKGVRPLTPLRPDPIFLDSFLNRALVSEGLARYNSVNSPYKDVLKEAQEKAKTGKLGIWSETCRNVNPTTECTIKGNIRAGRKTYFLPVCPNYEDVIIDTSYGDRWFCTEEEATSSGFRPSYGCNML